MDSEKMTPGMVITALVTMVPRELGKMCLKISRRSLAPRVRAASTYSCPLKR